MKKASCPTDHLPLWQPESFPGLLRRENEFSEGYRRAQIQRRNTMCTVVARYDPTAGPVNKHSHSDSPQCSQPLHLWTQIWSSHFCLKLLVAYHCSWGKDQTLQLVHKNLCPPFRTLLNPYSSSTHPPGAGPGLPAPSGCFPTSFSHPLHQGSPPQRPPD